MGVALLSGCLYRSRSCLKSSSITCPPRDPAIEQRSATFAGTDKSPSESSSAVLTRDLLSASVSVFSSPGQMIRVVSHPEELFHADLFIPKLRYSSANMSRLKNARKPLTAVGEENRRTAFNRSESVQNRTAMILQQPNLTVDTANLILVAFTFMWMLRGWTSSFVWHDLSDMDNAQHINIFGFISRQPIHLTVDRVPEGLDKSEARF
ncbi:hypothetical protein T4D_11283 [Trichinella pseudospiralis]|uniref:Uncharacterized protein n=1 Tax=Trichinella pseudospiralis TaxID=6337 RepID=A0A0V1FAY6_TRIPS|nr:hypothetical protein T4D_11283 [Trichinella pseudospiralis]